MSYGVEIWGWKEREGMERLEERYLRWVFGLDSKTPGYIVRKEVKRKRINKVMLGGNKRKMQRG